MAAAAMMIAGATTAAPITPATSTRPSRRAMSGPCEREHRSDDRNCAEREPEAGAEQGRAVRGAARPKDLRRECETVPIRFEGGCAENHGAALLRGREVGRVDDPNGTRGVRNLGPGIRVGDQPIAQLPRRDWSDRCGHRRVRLSRRCGCQSHAAREQGHIQSYPLVHHPYSLVVGALLISALRIQ
jgi:hypothetical protein